MSVWGKILGGAAGFALGGPLGALLGAVAGHAIDKMRADSQQATAEGGAEDPALKGTRQVAFTIGVIVLGAKMAKADGRVTPEEIAAFKQVFHIPPDELKNVGRLFNQARRDAAGFEPYARQLGRMFRDSPQILEQLLDGLFHIARADGRVTEGEINYLEQVAECFGLSPETWRRMRAENVGPDHTDPYQILGVAHDADAVTIKQAHRKLVLEHHPDRLVAEGMPQEFVEQANERLARINAAYDRIRKERGF